MFHVIQIRHVPRELRAILTARAAMAGQSLSDFLLAQLKRVAERPSRAELLKRLATRAPVRPSPSPARAIRVKRDGR